MIRIAILVLVTILLWFMSSPNKDARKISNKDLPILILVILCAGYPSHLFHEFGHWLVGTLLGNEMSMGLNRAWPVSGNYFQESHELFILLGGPSFTILQAIIALLLIEKYRTIYAYPFLFTSFFDRFFPLTFATFAEQDEARISAILRLGTYTIAIIICFVLFVFVWRGSRTLKLHFYTISAFFLWTFVSLLIVMGTNKLLYS